MGHILCSITLAARPLDSSIIDIPSNLCWRHEAVVIGFLSPAICLFEFTVGMLDQC